VSPAAPSVSAAFAVPLHFHGANPLMPSRERRALKTINAKATNIPDEMILGALPAPYQGLHHPPSILPTAITTTKSSKTIEIVTIPDAIDVTKNRKSIGIGLDENLILRILSSRYESVVITCINTLADLIKLATRKPDLVFSGVKYFNFSGTDLWLNDFLDRHGIAYMASNRKALDRESDKSRAKNIMRDSGVATARHFITAPDTHPTAGSVPLEYPLFVKPLTGGDSRGIDANSIVYDFESFRSKVMDIHQSQALPCLVETYLSGREFSVGIFEDNASQKLTAMPIEIIVDENKNGDRILDFDIKKFDRETVTAVTDILVHKQLSDLAKAAFKALGGKSFGRIDVKMDANQVPHFIEANLMPGLRKGYFYRACLLNLEMDYEQMILRIADNGLTHNSDKTRHHPVATLELTS
jgi:D-alanine-D-alanine ligase